MMTTLHAIISQERCGLFVPQDHKPKQEHGIHRMEWRFHPKKRRCPLKRRWT
jgi:hypothetical protein